MNHSERNKNDMKKTVFLGDSILLEGYGRVIGDRLADVCTCWQPPRNGCFTANTLRLIHDCRKQIEGADVIHFNNGLWDACHLFDDLYNDGIFTPDEDYVRAVCRLARILSHMGKTVIFATTTPVWNHPEIVNEEVIARNALVVPELQKMGVVINDLHSLIWPKYKEYIREDDHIHLNRAGIEVAAAQVEAVIRANL